MHVLWLKNELRAKKRGTVASSAYCYTTHKSGMAWPCCDFGDFERLQGQPVQGSTPKNALHGRVAEA